MSPQQREGSGDSAIHLRRISGRTTFLLVALIGFLAHLLQWVLLPFAIAGLLAYVGSALIDWLLARTRLKRKPLAVALFLVAVAAAALAGYVAVPPLLHGLSHLSEHLQALAQTLARAALGNGKANVFGQDMDANSLAKSATSGLENSIEKTAVLAPLGGAAFAALFGVPLTLALFLYFLLGGPTLARGLLWLVPPKDRPLAERIWLRLDPVLKRYFLGVLVVVAYASGAAYVGLGLFLHAPHAVLLALTTGLLEMIPVVGPGASAVIAGLVTVEHAKGVGPILAYAAYATALRLSIDQWLGPLALGAAARLHPTVIMFCFLVGGALFGVVGVILAVPAALVTKTALTVLYEDAEGAKAG